MCVNNTCDRRCHLIACWKIAFRFTLAAYIQATEECERLRYVTDLPSSSEGDIGSSKRQREASSGTDEDDWDSQHGVLRHVDFCMHPVFLEEVHRGY